MIIANSNYTAQSAENVYGRNKKDITIRYPRIDDAYWMASVSHQPRDYCLYIGRLARLVKVVDRLIWLANETETSLIIVGS